MRTAIAATFMAFLVLCCNPFATTGSSLTRKTCCLMLIVLSLASICHAADPVVSLVTTTVRGNEHITLVDVTFTFSDADGDDCHVALFGHDAVTRQHFPMVTFLGGNGPRYLGDETFAPGTHTVTWVASADTAADFTSNDFTVYVQVSDSGRIAPGQYIVIDVSGGTGASSYPVEYLPYVDVTQDARPPARAQSVDFGPRTSD